MARALTEHYGKPAPAAWGLDPFEAMLATLLDRALEPARRDRAIEALRDAGLLVPLTLAEVDLGEVVEALRSEGVKIPEKGLAPLPRLARWLVEQHLGDAGVLAGPDGSVPTEQLREELSAINGIGPTTTDAILLFALRRPVYPIDRPTYRVFLRHGWIDSTFGQDEARDAVERLAPGDPQGLARYSAWFERVGKDFCRATVAKCESCPLKPFLPEGGPVEPSG